MDDRLRKSDYTVRTVPLTVAQATVEAHHYAGGGSNTATFRHGLFRVGVRDCLGVAWWIPPTKPAARATWPADWTKVLALSRLVITPGVPKNAATFLLMRSVRMIRERADPWRCLVTYADTWRGHTGHIYKAAGWEELGLTDPEEVWVDARGRMVARKAGPTTRTRAEMIALGYESKGRHPKWKFRLVLPPPRPRRDLFTAPRPPGGGG